MKTSINWDVSQEDFSLIVKVSRRIEQELPNIQERSVWIMDLMACHQNGCKLQLAELLKADEYEFSHDVLGILKHINRETGKLEGFFTPRYAQQFVEA